MLLWRVLPLYTPCFFLLLLMSLLPLANASTIARDDPEQMLKQATNELLAISTAARAYVKEGRQRYYAETSAILDQVIDKDYFARGVMATYASARLYKSLATDNEREAFKRRVRQFSDALQTVLIEKYADTLLVFDGERITIESLGGESHTDKAGLLQTIYDTGNRTYSVQYNLHKRKDGWLINNVIVEGINLGATYRNQFAEAVEKNQGDVDYVVQHWQELMNQNTAKTAIPGSDVRQKQTGGGKGASNSQ